MTPAQCYCRGAGICPNCNHHACTDCQCDDIDSRQDHHQ